MRKWIKSLFNQPRLEVVLPEKPVYAHGDEEDIRSLASHPGFILLTYRLQAQAAVLDAKLRTTKHDSLREVDRLQLGSFWLNWLKAEVDKAVKNKAEAHRAATKLPDEEQFQQILASLQGV